jgi:catechol 2,3-dioxygenase-like lactoylglutathione lyase family enzyme
MQVIGIDHIQLAIPPGGEAAARAFYGGVLGLIEAPKPEPMRARGGMWFVAGPIGIHLGIEPDMRASLKAHPALRIADFDAALAAIRAAGIEAKLDTELPGIRRAHIRDPFGNRFELIDG